MKKLATLLIAFILSFGSNFAQEKLSYQKPPKEILELVNSPLAPAVIIDSKGDNVVLLYRDAYKSIAELSEVEMRLGGLRINPKTNIGSRTTYYNNIKVKKSSVQDATQVKGLPSKSRLSNFSISPNEKLVACLHTTSEGAEVWVIDVEAASAIKITGAMVNANLRDPINWFKDSRTLLVKMLVKNRKSLINTAEAIPEGPTISVSSGEKAQNRTYQDLLKNPNDEFNFEQLAISEIKKVSLEGKSVAFLPPAMYRNISFSPDGKYVLVSKIKKPFSYIVTYSRFPFDESVYDANGNLIKVVNDVPLNEVQPKGFMATRKGKRNMDWRSDKASTLYWVESLDGGDPENEVAYRDVIYELEAPFSSEGKEILKTINRLYTIDWGNDNIAIATDYWWNDRNTKSYIFNPSDNSVPPVKIYDRNSPGSL